MIAAEAGSDELRSCMSDAPCGCDRIADAQTECHMDPIALDMETRQGETEQRAWSCPVAGFDEPDEAPFDCRTALGNVKRALGAEGFRTCPLYYTRLPWVANVVELYEAKRMRLLHVADPDMNAPTFEALVTLDRAIRKRHAREEKKRADELKAKSERG